MKKYIVCLFVALLFFPARAYSAGDIDSMLFTPSKKVSAVSKKGSLIPRITKSESKKSKKTSQTLPPAVVTDEPLPEVAIMPQKKEKKSKSLKEVFEEKGEEIKEEIKEEKDSLLKDTWVEKISTSIKEKTSAPDDGKGDRAGSGASLELMTRDSASNSGGRSNASVFDVSGVMLRMSLAQAESALLKRGYKIISKKFEIPNFIKWRYEEQCRNSGVVGYERLNSCVVKAAQETNHQYVESAKFAKYDSQEEVNIWLTSNFTNNKVYKVAYSTGITNINRGSGQKIQYLHNVKTFEFWRRINQKYGTPDNKSEVLWGLGGNKPYMKAATGKLLLEDPMLRELDYTRMSREDAKFMNTNLYNF